MSGKISGSDLVSVLMCANRSDAYLLGAVNSLLGQSYANLEIILVANGADAELIFEKYFDLDPRLKLIKSPFYGLTTNLNLGLYYCNGQLVARMDSDDFAYPGRIEDQVKLFQAMPDLSVCGSSCDLIDRAGNTIASRSVPSTNDEIRKKMPFGNPFFHPSVMFKKSVVTSAGGYLSGFYAEDYDLWIRLANDNTVIFFNIKTPLLQYRIWPTAARGSCLAYETSAYACTAAFLRGQGGRYLIGAFLNWGKYFFSKIKFLFAS